MSSLAASLAAALLVAAAPASRAPIVRERKEVLVAGAKEVWRLEWAAVPKPFCDDEPDGLITCPCQGLAVGEVGELWLVRTRPGKPDQRLALAPLFASYERGTDARGAVLRRFDAERWYAAKPAERAGLPSLPVMQVADYSGDGGAQFVLQLGNNACGHQPSLLIGVTARRNELHALATSEQPGEPLVLERMRTWEELRERGRVESIELACGDHGAELSVAITVSRDEKGLHSARAEYACDDNGNRGKLLPPQ